VATLQQAILLRWLENIMKWNEQRRPALFHTDAALGRSINHARAVSRLHSHESPLSTRNSMERKRCIFISVCALCFTATFTVSTTCIFTTRACSKNLPCALTPTKGIQIKMGEEVSSTDQNPFRTSNIRVLSLERKFQIKTNRSFA